MSYGAAYLESERRSRGVQGGRRRTEDVVVHDAIKKKEKGKKHQYTGSIYTFPF